MGDRPLYDNPSEFTRKAITEESLPWTGMGRKFPVANVTIASVENRYSPGGPHAVYSTSGWPIA